MKNRRTLFRMAALCVGLLIPVAIELVCRGLESEAAVDPTDGFVEYLSERPLFVLNADEQTYHIAENRRTYFAADSFPKNSTLKTRRIFVLGGSTVQGRPYSLPTSFPTCMETALNVAAPEFDWDVVNCGGVSYASYRLLPILNEVLDYEPAAIVVCTGHNEFLEFMTYRDAVEAVDTFGETAAGWTNLATVRWARRLFSSGAAEPEKQRNQTSSGALSLEVEAMLDQSDGWAMYHREGLDRNRIESQFARNLKRMVAVCAAGDVPLLLVSPPINLRDCPPFKSEFDSSINSNQQQFFLTRLAQSDDLQAVESKERTQILRELCSEQPEYALVWYQWGRDLLGQGRVEDARVAFQTACDEDICPLRMTSSLRATFRKIATDSNVPFVDLHQFLEDESRHQILGDDVLVDHVHPSFSSHRKIGCLLADQLLKIMQQEVSVDSWRARAKSKMQNDFDSLDSMYFLRGQRALENLKGWARGRAHGTELN